MRLREAFFHDFFSSLFFLLSIPFLGEQMGFYSDPLNRMLGCFFLLAYIVSISKRNRIFHRTNKLLLYIVTLILFLLVLIAPLPPISVAFALIISFLFHNRQASFENKVGLIFFFYLLFHDYVPFFFLFEKTAADSLNTFINFITPFDIYFSPYAYGFGYLTIILSLAILSSMEIAWKRNGFIFVILGASLSLFLHLTMHVLYLLASSHYLNIERPKGFGLDRYYYYILGSFFPMNGHLFIFIFLLAAFFLFSTFLKKKIGLKLKSDEHQNPYKYKGMPVVSLLLSIVLFMLYWNLDFGRTDFSLHKKPSIYVYDTDMDFEIVPNKQIFGARNGMFAMLFDYLRDWSYNVQLGVNWNQVRAENNDIIMLINPHGRLTMEERDRFRSFLKRGGRLFVLGDHTYMFGLKNDYFALTEELGIAFNFDTAIYFRSFWVECLRSPYLTLNRLINRDDFLTQIVQGASLSISIPAVPLIIGQFGWSDSGDLANEEGYLGDRRYSPQEPTGDVVLAAERHFGKGKLLVFGDTTFIQNTPISSAYPLIRLCLAHLLPRNRILIRIIPVTLFLLLCCTFWMVSLLYRKNRLYTEIRGSFLPIQIILFIFFMWIGFTVNTDSAFITIAEASTSERVGIDTTFFNSFFSRDWYKSGRGLGGLKNTIYRAGMLPYHVYLPRTYSKSDFDLFFLIAPNQKIGKKEAKELYSFLNEGGIMIFACGWEHRKAAKELLDLLSLDIDNIPLSRLSGPDTDLNLHFLSAWPIEIKDHKDVKILCKAWVEYPVIIEKRINKGKLFLIGDSYFFENRNLETYDGYLKYNSLFVEEIINRNR